MSDLIDRQSAIDALEDAEDAFGYLTKDWREVLEQLPSIQPEIIRCMECKYYEASIACNPWGVCCHKDWVANSIGHNVDETGWCYRAERRTE